MGFKEGPELRGEGAWGGVGAEEVEVMGAAEREDFLSDGWGGEMVGAHAGGLKEGVEGSHGGERFDEGSLGMGEGVTDESGGEADAAEAWMDDDAGDGSDLVVESASCGGFREAEEVVAEGGVAAGTIEDGASFHKDGGGGGGVLGMASDEDADDGDGAGGAVVEACEWAVVGDCAGGDLEVGPEGAWGGFQGFHGGLLDGGEGEEDEARRRRGRSFTKRVVATECWLRRGGLGFGAVILDLISLFIFFHLYICLFIFYLFY
jgi:hypothetical protein